MEWFSALYFSLAASSPLAWAPICTCLDSLFQEHPQKCTSAHSEKQLEHISKVFFNKLPALFLPKIKCLSWESRHPEPSLEGYYL